MMFVRRDPSIEMPPEDRTAMPAQVGAWVAEMERRGIRLHGAVFEPPEATRTDRLVDGDAHVTSGSHSPDRDLVSGYNLLECADLAEAIDVAAVHPIARFGSIELRPLASP